MARISGLERKQAPWHLRWFYGAMRKMFGKDLTPAKLQMRVPGLVLGRHRHGSRSRPQTASLPALYSIGKSTHRGAHRLSLLNDINSAVGRKAGLSDEKLRVVHCDDMTPFNDTERLVIELADAMAETPSNVSDDLYARLRNQFSEEQLLQLGGQIAFENYRARWNRLFNVESDNNLYTPHTDQSRESR
jgi:hypothetical protein